MRILAIAICLCVARSAAAETDMSSLWPNADGHSWEYRQTYNENLWYDPETTVNQARLYFNGYDTVPGGIEVQNLEVAVLPPPAAKSLSSTAPRAKRQFAVAAPASIQNPFLRTLWQVRADLRDAIEKKAADPDDIVPDRPGFYQILLHEAAYKKTEENIGAYRRDQNAMMSWLWLVEDLTVGSSFELQLVPDLADDAWLYGTIAAWEDVEVPAGEFSDCLRVDYLISYGESICTDIDGHETGGFTSETRGFIHYAPDVGPINTYEEFIPITEIIWGECDDYFSQHIGEVAASGSLQLTSDDPVLTEQASWGSMKGAYRR